MTLKPRNGNSPHAIQSNRADEVLCLIASGTPVSGIAETLHLGATTISTYRARILEKMHLKNNAELIRYALQRGLVS